MVDDADVRQVVMERLTRAGLVGAGFDIDDLTADFAARMDMDRSLDTLIGAGAPGAGELSNS